MMAVICTTKGQWGKSKTCRKICAESVWPQTWDTMHIRLLFTPSISGHLWITFNYMSKHSGCVWPGFSSQSYGFNPRWLYTRFLVDEEALKQISCAVASVFPYLWIPSLLHTQLSCRLRCSSTYVQTSCYHILTGDLISDLPLGWLHSKEFGSLI